MMGKHHASKEEDWGFGSAPAAPPPAPKKPATPPPATPKPEADNKVIPASLRDLSAQSIAETFQKISAHMHSETQAFAETLSALQSLVVACQNAGLPQIGLEQAGFDRLREMNMIKEGASQTPPLAHYAFLSIDDVRILIRVLPDNVIDCYNENINKPRSKPLYLDHKVLWHPTGRDDEGAFRRFDLSADEGKKNFIQTVLITAAESGALQSLRQYDVPSKAAPQHLQKPQRSSLPKPA